MSVLLPHVGDGVVLGGVVVGPVEHHVGLAERACTLPLDKQDRLKSLLITNPTLSEGVIVLLISCFFCWLGDMVTV